MSLDIEAKVKALSKEIVGDLENRLHFHPSTAESAEIHNALRALAVGFAKQALALVPAGRYASLMLTDIESADMWAHKAVALADPAVAPAVDKVAADVVEGATDLSAALGHQTPAPAVPPPAAPAAPTPAPAAPVAPPARTPANAAPVAPGGDTQTATEATADAPATVDHVTEPTTSDIVLTPQNSTPAEVPEPQPDTVVIDHAQDAPEGATS